MSSLENIFIKQFRQALSSRDSKRDIFSLPLPSEVSNWDVSGSDMYGVKGIPSGAGLFSKLNKSLVKKLPSNINVGRRKVDLVNRTFAKDSSGNYIYEKVKIPTGSQVVLSKVNLRLPFKYKSDLEGFGYIDFIVTSKGQKEFMYYIPKIYLYETNQTALALSVKNMKNYYGSGYTTWDFGVVYLHIVPYKPNQKYVGTRILKTSHKLNYSNEVKYLVNFWESNNIIPNISLCNTSIGNLCLKQTTRGYDGYTPISTLNVYEKEYQRGVNDEV